MKILACYINLGWACLLAPMLTIVAGLARSPSTIAIAGGGLAYLIVACFAMAHRRWAIGTVVVTVSLTALVTGVFTVINVAMFLLGHELYRDSPGTIVVVAINAAVFTAPALVILSLFVAHGLTHMPARRGVAWRDKSAAHLLRGRNRMNHRDTEGTEKSE